MRAQATVDASPGQLARAEMRGRRKVADKATADRQKLKHFPTRCPVTAIAVLEAQRLGYGPDSARMLVEQVEQELQQGRDRRCSQ